MSGLTSRIRPGDALSVAPLNTNFAQLDLLLSDIADRQLVDGAIDTRHCGGSWVLPYVEQVAGPLNPAVWTRLAPAALTNYPVETGQAIYIRGSCRVNARCEARRCRR